MDCKRFKGYMAEHDIKQADIADLLHISPENVNAKVNGRQPFTLEQVQLLCKTYDISADYYFI